MSKFNNTYSNTNQNHPLQQNSQNYLTYKKYVSIHSEDRDALAFPNSAEFEIELPEDITNISTMKLHSWALPSNYDTFSALNSNITMVFRIVDPYDPINYSGPYTELINMIYEALITYNNSGAECKEGGIFTIVIEEGFYNQVQLVTEITNKFNEAVTKIIIQYLEINNPSFIDTFLKAGGYSRFVVAYNNVSQKIWFGNQADSFELLNETVFLYNDNINEKLLCKKSQVPDFSSWGLPGNLGLTRCNVKSISGIDTTDNCVFVNNCDNECNDTTCCHSNTSTKYCNYKRFYYGDYINTGDNGYWLLPATDPSGNVLNDAYVQYIECPYKVNIFGPSHIYMEIFKYNCIDETQPYNISKFTLTSNITNGIVNSAFAKIPVVSTPLSQYYDGPVDSYKFFDPPVERIRRLRFKLRYHNGELVNFGLFEYSFTLEFTTLLPMINRSVNFVNNI